MDDAPGAQGSSIAVPGGVWTTRVARQVRDHLAQLGGVPEHRPIAVPGRVTEISRSGAVTRRSSAAWSVNSRRSTGDAPWLGDLVQLREQQQILDQHAHPLASDSIRVHRAGQRLGVLGGAHAKQLGVAADRRQRRAEFVRRVGEEAAQPILGLLPVGERGLDLSEHLVQRASEPPDLGPRVRWLHAARQVAGGDLRGGLSDPRSGRRPIRITIQPSPISARITPTPTISSTTDQPVQRLIDLVQRDRHRQGVARPRPERRGAGSSVPSPCEPTVNGCSEPGLAERWPGRHRRARRDAAAVAEGACPQHRSAWPHQRAERARRQCGGSAGGWSVGTRARGAAGPGGRAPVPSWKDSGAAAAWTC